MKSIERRFRNIQAKNSAWSLYICFAEAVKGQKFSRPVIGKWFLRLVEKNDYEKQDQRRLLRQLYSLSQLEE